MRRERTLTGELKQSTLPIPGRIYRARLAERYDGIGQYVLVNLSGGSTSSALRARVATGDFGGRREFPRGTPVTVAVRHGYVEVFLGNRALYPCGRYDICCPDVPGEGSCNAFNGAEVTSPNTPGAFSDVQGKMLDKLTDGHCGTIWEVEEPGSGGVGLHTPVIMHLLFTTTRSVRPIFSSELVVGSAFNIMDKDDSTFWQSNVLGTWVGLDLGTPRPISQFRLLQGVNPRAGGSPAYADDFSIKASVDGGVTYTEVHREVGGGSEVAKPLSAGTIVARHWQVHINSVGVQGYPWAVYSFELKDISGKNWGLLENSPPTVYDERRANWIYLYQNNDVYFPEGLSLSVNDQVVVSDLLANSQTSINNNCSTSTDTLVLRLSKWKLPKAYVGHKWDITIISGGFWRATELLGFYIPP